jgi:hypothetical protein
VRWRDSSPAAQVPAKTGSPSALSPGIQPGLFFAGIRLPRASRPHRECQFTHGTRCAGDLLLECRDVPFLQLDRKDPGWFLRTGPSTMRPLPHVLHDHPARKQYAAAKCREQESQVLEARHGALTYMDIVLPRI